MKTALLATAIFWLVVWAVVAWRVGIAPLWLGLYLVLIGTYLALGLVSFGGKQRRWLASMGALALAIAVAVPTFLDTRLLAGGLALAAAAAVDPREPES